MPNWELDPNFSVFFLVTPPLKICVFRLKGLKISFIILTYVLYVDQHIPNLIIKQCKNLAPVTQISSNLGD